MKAFLEDHKWIAWVIALAGIAFSYTSANTGGHVLIVIGALGLLITYASNLTPLFRKMGYDRGLRFKVLFFAAIAVLAVIGAVSNGIEADQRKTLAYEQSVTRQRQNVVQPNIYTNSGSSNNLGLGDFSYSSYGLDTDTSSYAVVPKKTICFACHGSGVCSLCNGTGTYRNYGLSSDCSCDDGKCSTCDGDGFL